MDPAMAARPTSTPKRSPPTVPQGMPVSAGAVATARGQLPNNSTPAKQQYNLAMPPPRLPVNTPSIASSTSSRPSLSMSDASEGFDNGLRVTMDERIKTPLQELSSSNLSLESDVDVRFEQLLETLEVPTTVRMKFGTVAKDVKMSILDASMTSNANTLSTLGLFVPPTPEKRKAQKKMSTPRLRKAKSSAELKGENANSRPSSMIVGGNCNIGGDQFTIVASPVARPASQMMSRHTPRGSMDISSRPHTPSRPSSSMFMSGSPSPRRGNGNGNTPGPAELPDSYVLWLQQHRATSLDMDVGRAKKLRMLLRHEATGWVAAFLDAGGYMCILDRIQDLLDIEWREEQHDDQMLYELLRCVKALTTSEVGKAALREAHPKPFPALSKLLFSEKKPGDIACRQIIVELWQFYFELFPTNQQAAGGLPNTPRTAIRFNTAKQPSIDVVAFIRSLLTPEKDDDKTKDYHEFVTVAHRPRVFKAWVQELSDICRDYFWIMCHGSNTLWNLADVDEQLVERPVAPGGATGGVEFEAMGYVTAHFKLLNMLASAMAEQDRTAAHNLHSELMQSGLDRILVTMRKASTTYYPTLHLELARYIDVVRRVSPDGKLPYLIGKMVGPPPEELRRHKSAGEWLPRTEWR